MRTILIALLTVVALGACGGKAETAPPGADAQKDDAPAFVADEASLKAAAEEVSLRYSSKDFGGYWDLWSAADKKQTSRDALVAYAEKCEWGGLPLEIQMARLEPDGKTGIVRAGLGNIARTTPYVVEDGGWKQDTSEETHKTVASGKCP